MAAWVLVLDWTARALHSSIVYWRWSALLIYCKTCNKCRALNKCRVVTVVPVRYYTAGHKKTVPFYSYDNFGKDRPLQEDCIKFTTSSSSSSYLFPLLMYVPALGLPCKIWMFKYTPPQQWHSFLWPTVSESSQVKSSQVMSADRNTLETSELQEHLALTSWHK